MTFGFWDGSRNFRKLFSVSLEGFVLHGYDWIHWEAKSCTTTEYRWLFRDSLPTLRTLWSAVIKSPNFLHEVRLRQYVFCKEGVLVILVRFGEARTNIVLPGCHFHRSFWIWVMRNVCGCSRLSVNSCDHSGRYRKRFPAACWLSIFSFGFGCTWIAWVSWRFSGSIVTSKSCWIRRGTRWVLRERCGRRTRAWAWRQSWDNTRNDNLLSSTNLFLPFGPDSAFDH